VIDAPIAALTSRPAARATWGMPTSGRRRRARWRRRRWPISSRSRRYMDDLRKESKDSVTLGQNAAWIDRWARKIERLPMLDVDNDMLDYGGYVAAALRASSDVRSRESASTRAPAPHRSTAAVWAGRIRLVRRLRWYIAIRKSAERGAVRAEERAKGATSALGTLQADCRVRPPTCSPKNDRSLQDRVLIAHRPSCPRARQQQFSRRGDDCFVASR
jgi:hypothetical protein